MIPHFYLQFVLFPFATQSHAIYPVEDGIAFVIVFEQGPMAVYIHLKISNVRLIVFYKDAN